METIIKSMSSLLDILASIKAFIDSQEEEAGDELAGLQEEMNAAFNLAVAIHGAMKRIEATPQETAELIAEAARAALRPIGEEGTD